MKRIEMVNKETKRIEKIEVKKSSGVYTYTGVISEYDEENIQIDTTRGESLVFRKDQIDGRILVEMKRDETNEETS